MSCAAYLNAERWTEAACIGWDSRIFFPKHVNAETASLAIAICETCPLVDACRDEYATEEFGVFGATTPRQRRAARHLKATS